MANDPAAVAEEVRALTSRWNPPPRNNVMDKLVGQPVPQGDSRATAHIPSGLEDSPLNPGNSQVDASTVGHNPFADDLDDADAPEDYSDEKWTKKALKAEIDLRNAGREGDDVISSSGNKGDLVARLVADDAAQAEAGDAGDDGDAGGGDDA